MSATTKFVVEPRQGGSSASAPDPSVGPRRPPLFRWGGLWILTSLFFVAILYFILFFDLNLKQYLQEYGTLLNGAQVNIGSVHTSFWDNRIELTDIQIAHNANPMHNLLQVDRVTADYLVGPLFANKLIVTNLRIEGLRYNTQREQSGLPTLGSSESVPPTGLLDRATPTLFSKVPNHYDSSPLGRLARFSMGLDIQTKIDNQVSGLQSRRALDTIRHDFEEQIERWRSASLTLPASPWYATARAELKSLLEQTPGHDSRQSASLSEEAQRRPEQRLAELERRIVEGRQKVHQIVTTFEGGTSALQKRLGAIDQSVDQDIVSLRQSFGLPQLQQTDLTPMLFGPRALNYLDRLSYWIDFTRRRMPKGSRNGQLIFSGGDPSHGMTIHFGKMSAYPSLLIEKGTVTSDLADAHGGLVRGHFEGITSDPPIYRKPAHVVLDADFPGQRIGGVHLELLVDHTIDAASETIDFSALAFPVSQWAIHNSSDLAIGIQHGTGQFSFHGTFDEKSVKANWTADIQNIDYTVVTPYQELHDTMQGIFDRFPNLEVRGNLLGQPENPKMQLDSNLGRELAVALQAQFKLPMEAIDDSLRKFILDSVSEPRQQLTSKIRDFRAHWEETVDNEKKDLDELTTLASRAAAKFHRVSAQE